MLRNEAVVLAAEANRKAAEGQYYCAIDLYTRAVGHYPFDYRFYVNRAYCYERCELYHMALADADEALRQQPTGQPKCHFRRARALVGLREYAEAERVYRQIMDVSTAAECPEIERDLKRLRRSALVDMGFDAQAADRGAARYETIQAAVDALLADKVSDNSSIGGDTRDVNVDGLNDNSGAGIKYKTADNSDDNNDKNRGHNCWYSSPLKDMDVKAPESPHCPGVTDSSHVTTNYEIGQRYADKARKWAQVVDSQSSIISSLRTTTTTPASPTAITKPLATLLSLAPAMTTPMHCTANPSTNTPVRSTNIWGYNGLRVENVSADNRKVIQRRFAAYGRLLAVEPKRSSRSCVWIHYDNPVSPVEAIIHMQSTICPELSFRSSPGQPLKPLRLFFAPTNDQPELKFCRPKQPADNQGECYYWRTTNCSLEDKCPLNHIPVNKHIDAQVWMKCKDGTPIC